MKEQLKKLRLHFQKHHDVLCMGGVAVLKRDADGLYGFYNPLQHKWEWFRWNGEAFEWVRQTEFAT